MSEDTELVSPIYHVNLGSSIRRAALETKANLPYGDPFRDTPTDSEEGPQRRILNIGDFMVGRKERYRIIRPFTRTLNCAYLAESTKTKKEVVLKDSYPASPDFDLFSVERDVLARVKHPALVELYDTSHPREGRFLVMNYIPGEDLHGIIEETGFLHPHSAWDILGSVCEVLIILHGLGIVHRDIKPQNIIVRPDQTGALIDLGLARFGPKDILQLPGTAVGTPQYMSPEQCAGERCDARSDVYSLGLVLTEMLIGRPVYSAATKEQVMLQQKLLPMRPPNAVHPCLPKEISDIAMWATQKNPRKRYPRVQLFKEALGESVEKTVGSYQCSC